MSRSTMCITAAVVALAAALLAASLLPPRPAEAAGYAMWISFQFRSTTCTKAVAQGANGFTSITADGAAAQSICVYVEDQSTGLGVDGAPVEIRTIVGTVGASGTSRYSGFLFTTGGGITSISYRGDGRTFGGDTAVATYGTRAVATNSVQLTPPAGRFPTKLTMSAVGAPRLASSSTDPDRLYSSPTPGVHAVVQVQDVDGLGVNGQIVLVQSEQAKLVANPGFAQTPAAACAAATARALVLTTGATDLLVPAGIAMPGTADLTVCADADRAPGEVDLVTQAVSAPLPEARLALRHVGRPAAVTATVEGATLTAAVTDRDGQPVVDGTPVTFVLPPLAGAVSTSCATTRDGNVTATLAVTAEFVTALAVATYNERGAAASCAVPGLRLVTTSVHVREGSR